METMQRGKQWLEDLLKLSGFPATVEATLGEEEEDSTSYWLTIDREHLTPNQIQTLIGGQGSTLDAIQYLANSILNITAEPDRQGAYTVEINGYRIQRQAEIRALVEDAAVRVRETGEDFEMKSLSSAERRQIHTLLKDSEDLETFSRGQEPDRRLVIKKK